MGWTMTSFEIISIVFLSLAFIGSIIALYIKAITAIAKLDSDTKVAIAELNLQIIELRKKLLEIEINAIRVEDINRKDHITIIEKIDKLIDK